TSGQVTGALRRSPCRVPAAATGPGPGVGGSCGHRAIVTALLLGRVAELADALASGASVRKDVGVQVPPRPPGWSPPRASTTSFRSRGRPRVADRPHPLSRTGP